MRRSTHTYIHTHTHSHPYTHTHTYTRAHIHAHNTHALFFFTPQRHHRNYQKTALWSWRTVNEVVSWLLRISASGAVEQVVARPWKFSPAKLPLNLLYNMTIRLTFENFYLWCGRASRCASIEISKVKSPLNLLCNMTVELTFENFSQSSSTLQVAAWTQVEIRKSPLATQFTIYLDYRTDFWEFLCSARFSICYTQWLWSWLLRISIYDDKEQTCEILCQSNSQLNGRKNTSISQHTLQDTTTHCKTLQDTATHCNTLQHTATHCNILQHTATQSNSPPSGGKNTPTSPWRFGRTLFQTQLRRSRRFFARRHAL